jgi:hypothetical protein
MVLHVVADVPAVGCHVQVTLVYMSGPEGKPEHPLYWLRYAAKADKFMQLLQIEPASEYSLNQPDGLSG